MASIFCNNFYEHNLFSVCLAKTALNSRLSKFCIQEVNSFAARKPQNLHKKLIISSFYEGNECQTSYFMLKFYDFLLASATEEEDKNNWHREGNSQCNIKNCWMCQTVNFRFIIFKFLWLLLIIKFLTLVIFWHL